nr:PREDICTED: spexin-like [Paralichthys olivaceus]
MSLIVSLFVVTLVTQCWTAPQRRNWTPQAILYLKGALTHKLRGDGLVLSWASSVLLQLLQRAVEGGGNQLDDYPDKEELHFNYL